MRFIKTYESFKVEEPKTMSELLEKLSVVEKNIMDSIEADPIDNKIFFNTDLDISDIDSLSNNSEFSKLLKIKGLSKSNVEHTDDYETFLLSPFKYILLRDVDKNNLQDPDFIILQTFNSTEQDWNEIRVYKVNGNFRNFYDKLSNRTIELTDGKDNYIYSTSNKNEWELVNHNGNETFPKYIRKEDLLNLINSLR